MSWGEGDVRGHDKCRCLCKHLCTSTEETQASTERRNGKAKPRHYQ